MAAFEITDEIKDLQSNVVLTMLSDLKTQGKVTPELYFVY